MVYENTHLWAADTIRKELTNNLLREIITSHIDHYFLGAIFPDTLSYGTETKLKSVSGYLHGETQTPTNRIVFEVLDHIKNTRDEKNLAFICGFLTHCAMDIVFHPMVFYLSGYSPEGSPELNAQSAYLHWHFETYIDKHFNDSFFLDRLIKPKTVDDLIIASILKLSKKIIHDCLVKQITFFKRIHSRFFFRVYRMLAGIGLVEKKWIGGFYANLEIDPTGLPHPVEYKDIISGEDKKATLDSLMGEAIEMGSKMVESAYRYYAGAISRDVCEYTVVGNNLDTGRMGKRKADIKFSIKL